MNHNSILVILTGGTICSSTNEKGQRYSDAGNVKIIEAFKKSHSPFADKVHFETMTPTDILSENMTLDAWNTLITTLRDQIDWSHYSGVIMLHGTDTLAYTASLLSILLPGITIPVCMVSSQLPLDYEQTNGHANFRASVELIMNGIAPNVYAVYRNGDGVIYVHFGAHLLQCANYSEEFFSVDAMAVPDSDNAQLAGIPFETDNLLLNRVGELTPCVQKIAPFVGINYDAYDLEGVKAIVHGTYHSDTVCVERKNGHGNYSRCSILHLMDRCRNQGIQLFLAPCSPSAYKYESTGDILANGAHHICGVTNEMAYVKTLVGCALSLSNEELREFVNRSINHEVVY